MTDREQDRERDSLTDIRAAFEHQYMADSRDPSMLEQFSTYTNGWQAATAAAVPPGHVVVPVEPTIGRLMSMAIRDDHGLGVPGFYDNLSFTAGGPYWPPHQQRIEAAIARMRQLYEEAIGEGFYKPYHERTYAKLAAAEGK